MIARLRILLLFFIMSAIAIGATGITFYVLYEASFEQQRARLVEVAQSRARLIEAMARFDAQFSANDIAGGAFAATLGQIREAHKRFEGFGETGEFTLARHEGDRIVFLLRHRHKDVEKPEPVLLASDLAEPMRRALMGESGTVVGLDYRGEKVLAAHEPVDVLDLGVVAKIDLAEIRAPFLKAALLAGGGALALVFAGFASFVLAGKPLARRLEESENKYYSLFTSASDGVFVLTDVIEECNAQAGRLLGCECGDVVGRTLLDFSPPTQPDGRASAVAERERLEAAFSGKPQSFHWKLQRKDGVLIDATVSTKAVELAGRKVILATMHDVTERTRAEEALRESEERFRGAFETSPLGMTLIAPDGKYIRVNPAFREITGYSEAELMAGDFKGITHPDDLEASMKKLQRLVAGEISTCQFEKRYIHKQGHVVWVHISTSLVRDEEGRPLQVVNQIQDITERKRAEEAFERLSRQNEHILNAAGEGIYGIDLEGRTTFVNLAAAKMIGWSAEELIGRFQHDVLHHTKPDGSPYPWKECPIYAAFLDGEVHHVADEVFWRRNGASFPVEYVSTPIREDGKIVGAVVVFRDITERRRTEDQLRQALKMEAVGQLTGGVAHDFNNLLAVIMGNLELLDERLGGDESQKGLVRNAISAAERGATLTNRLLAFSRKQALKPCLTDLNHLVSGMTNLFQRTLGEPIRIETVLAGGLWRTLVDPGELENVLVNLAVNARDAMPAGGVLTIETANVRLDEEYAAAHEEVSPGRYVMLAVSDTGTGMTQEVKNRVFEPFFTTKEVGHGSGLGLSMVFGFVKQSGGHVKVYSEVSHGTSVKIYLPRASGEEAADHEETEPAPEMAGYSEEILVVEDDGDVRQLATKMLSELGYKVLAARDGESALAVLEEAPDIALLFTDVVLPGDMSGADLAREAMRRRPGLKALYTSGYTEDAIVHQERLDEAVELIVKPYRKVDLARKLRAVIDS